MFLLSAFGSHAGYKQDKFVINNNRLRMEHMNRLKVFNCRFSACQSVPLIQWVILTSASKTTVAASCCLLFSRVNHSLNLNILTIVCCCLAKKFFLKTCLLPALWWSVSVTMKKQNSSFVVIHLRLFPQKQHPALCSHFSEELLRRGTNCEIQLLFIEVN